MSSNEEPECRLPDVNSLQNDDARPGHASAQGSPTTELEPFALRLASLRPRADRLDRERLMFLAGQASALRSAEPGAYVPPKARFGAAGGWPAAFAAMTAIAATLFVMLVIRSQAPGIDRRPAPRAEHAVQPGDAMHASTNNTSTHQQPRPLAMNVQRNVAPPPRPAISWDVVGALWLPDFIATSKPTPALYPRRLEKVLTLGLDSWEQSSSAGNGSGDTAPLSYRQWLESLLDSGSAKPLPPHPPKVHVLPLGVQS